MKSMSRVPLRLPAGRRARCLAGLAIASLAAGQAAAEPAALPVPAEFVRKVREAVKLDYELQKDYTYVEKRRDVKLSGLGKVTVGALRTFEVYPSTQPGQTYKRLVAIDGKPLDAAELARRDEEHRAQRHRARRSNRSWRRRRSASFA